MKLTATTVRAAELPAGKSDFIFWDDEIPGFGLRLREGGSRSFIFQYKHGAKHRRMNLGIASPDTVGEARKNAAKLHARVRLGEDPAGDKAEAQRQAAETFKFYVDQYLDALRQRYRPRSFTEIQRHLTKHAKLLHQVQLTKVTRRDVAAVIVAVTNVAGGPTANRVRSSVSAFFT